MAKWTMLNIDSDLKYLDGLKKDFDCTYTSNIHSQAVNIEEQVIKKVLKDLLKRDATPEDAKKCTMVFRDGEPNKYTFLHDGLTLGYIERKLEGLSYNVTFTPHKY